MTLLAHVAPLGWEHSDLTGDYVWSNAEPKQGSGRYAMFAPRSCPTGLAYDFKQIVR
jgi:hypothetical protein